MPLPALLLDGHFWIDAPVEAFAFLIAFDECIVLSKVVPDTGLPTTCGGLELVPGIFLLDVVVNLLKVHLTSRRRRDSFVDKYHIVGRRTLQLLFSVVLDTHLGRRSTWRFDRLLLL